MSRGSGENVRSVTSSVGNLQEASPSLESTGKRNATNDDQLGKSEEEKEQIAESELTFVPWRVFINHIDSYHGRKLAETLPGRESPLDLRSDAQGVAFNAEDDTNGEKKHDDFTEQEREDEEVETHLSGGTFVSRNFEVVGTVKDKEYKRPEHVAMVIPSSKYKEHLLGELMKCGVVIYDITQDDSQISEALEALEGIVERLEKFRYEAPGAFKLSRDTRYFILISTVMTWCLTKPLNPEDPDLPFTEADYRKRKPHPNFKEHIKCEREVCTVAKRANLGDKLKTLVVGSGITYGDEEGPLHYLFKMAWQNADYLPIFGRGNNKIPLLHVRDLAEVVCMLVKNWPKPKYIIAVEQELVPQATIVKKISKALTTGKVKRIASEEAFLLPEVTQRTYDMINSNIKIEPAYVIENGLQFHFDTPFQDNVDTLVNDYKMSRNLQPVKIIVLGPPASGKTRLSQILAKHYGIHYISVENLISETIEKLSKEISDITTAADVAKRDNASMELEDVEELEEDRDDEELDEEDAPGVEELQEQLDEIRDNRTKNNGRLDDDILNKIFLRRLLSNDCRNQGYVIDGYPKTESQARGLFGSTEDEENIDEDEDDVEDNLMSDGNNKVLPELVVVLEACDEFLIERVVRLPEQEIKETHYTEEGMLRRLREYRERNTDDESPQQFFDELELHPFIIPVEDDICPEMFSTLIQCLKRLGEPRNYGPSDAEREEAKKRVEAEALARSMIEEARKIREDFERKMARERKMVEWTDLLEKLKEEEAQQLSVIAEPLRHYLVKYIFPTLSQALIEVARLRPKDPIDFLAEYLFKENPSGKMFEPDYTETMSMLLSAIEKLQEDILPESELDKGMTEQYLKRQGRRNDHEVPCPRTCADEVLTEDDENDDDDHSSTGCDGEKRAARDRINSRTLSNAVTNVTTMSRDKRLYYGDRTEDVAASSFSYDEINEG